MRYRLAVSNKCVLSLKLGEFSSELIAIECLDEHLNTFVKLCICKLLDGQKQLKVVKLLNKMD